MPRVLKRVTLIYEDGRTYTMPKVIALGVHNYPDYESGQLIRAESVALSPSNVPKGRIKEIVVRPEGRLQ